MSEDSRPSIADLSDSDGVPPEVDPVVDLNIERRRRGLPPIGDVVDDARLLIVETTCRHPSILVDHQRRRIACRACETELDPIMVLLQYAVRERSFLNHTAEAKAEQVSLLDDIDELKKQRDDLKRQLNRDQLVKARLVLEKKLHEVGRVASDFKYRYEALAEQLNTLGEKPCV